VFKRFNITFTKDRALARLLSFGSILFFVFFADAILSYWLPNYIQSTQKSSLVMGLVISFASIVSFGADLLFPQILRDLNIKKMVYFALLSSLLFSLSLYVALLQPFILVLLLSMAIWGVYYEFCGFSTQQFIAENVPIEKRAGSWGILSVFRTLAYFVGPLLAGFLVIRGNYLVVSCALIMTLIGLGIFSLQKYGSNRKSKIRLDEINLLREFSHWRVLFKTVWPIVLVSLFIGMIDATFWTTGAVFSEKLIDKSWLGTLFMPFYILPSIFMGFVVEKWGIYQGKKKMALKFLVVAGLLLVAILFSDNIFWLLLMVLSSSICLSVVYPLTDAVYTDIVARMGRERKHLIGLSNSTISLAFIIGPALAGFIANGFGEKMTLVIMGLAATVIAILLLAITPKKLKLSQREIGSWE